MRSRPRPEARTLNAAPGGAVLVATRRNTCSDRTHTRNDPRRAAQLVIRRGSRNQAEATDLSCDPGLRTAWSAHADELYGYARRALGDSGAAEEVLQETFLRAWRAADRYDASRPLRPWLFAILRNVVVDEARSRVQRPVPQDVGTREPRSELFDPLDRAMDAWLVEEALRRIGPEHRAVLVETYYRGRPYAEVAAGLGIPEGTARSRAFYGLRALRLALEEMGWEG
jgi:RNA polymerase sigma-70 factor (ECF subfamily)